MRSARQPHGRKHCHNYIKTEADPVRQKFFYYIFGISFRKIFYPRSSFIPVFLKCELIFLVDTYGFEEDGLTIKVYLSREDIANLSNMTTSNAIRTLSIFANENVISLEGRKIKVIDLQQLKRISELG